MDNISKHITYKEATRSNTAVRLGIKNEPNDVELTAMKLVAEKVFEPLHEWYGKPITVSSFFRSSKVNKAVKGSLTSQHTKGEAIDIDTQNDNTKLFMYIKDKMAFDQLIYEFGDDKNPAWVHVSFTKQNRGIILRAFIKNGKTLYEKMF